MTSRTVRDYKNLKHATMNCELPDACGNDDRQENLLAAQQRDDGRSRTERIMQRDKVLIIACVVMAVLMNFSTGKFVLYPFQLFSTWVHEMSHGTAAILVGGRIAYLQIFHDGSGLCYYYISGVSWKSAFVASAGYTGTAFWGGMLLLFRRTTLGPTIGTIAIGSAILLSCLLYVRNQFGLVVLSIEGFVLIFCGWFLPARWLDNLYAFLAAACSLNAILDIKNLFGASQGYVNGEVQNTDAHTVSEYWGYDYRFWAMLWFVFALFMTAVGVIFARDARELSSHRNKSGAHNIHQQAAPAQQQVWVQTAHVQHAQPVPQAEVAPYYAHTV